MKQQFKGGKGDKLNPRDVDPQQLRMGIKVELEHTDNKRKALEIALDHLSEDPQYYTKLKKAKLEIKVLHHNSEEAIIERIKSYIFDYFLKRLKSDREDRTVGHIPFSNSNELKQILDDFYESNDFYHFLNYYETRGGLKLNKKVLKSLIEEIKEWGGEGASDDTGPMEEIKVNPLAEKNIKENLSPSKNSFLSLENILKKVMINEYSQKILDQMLALYRPQAHLDDVQILNYINRHDQLKGALRQKFENPTTKATVEPLIPKELQDKNRYLDITLWKKFDDLKKVIDGISKKSEDIYKKMVDFYKKKNPNVDENAIKYYVERFKSRLKQLQQLVKDNNEEAINLIPKELRAGDKYLVISNWLDLHQLENLIDTIFPREQKKGAEKVELNSAETDGDLIYNKDKVEIYKGDSEHKCIRYGKNQYYSWCISRTQGSMYTSYRLGNSNRRDKLMFYFVFDKSKTDEKSGGRFIDPYHAVVIHAMEDGRYRLTKADNAGDSDSFKWSELSQAFEGPKGKALWDKIKFLQKLFQYLPPSKDELKQFEFKNKSLTLEKFTALSHEDKVYWLRANATDNKIVTPEITKTLDVNLKNDLINYGKVFSFDELKSNIGLLKRYPDYRFTRNPDEPLPYKFIPYLKEELQRKYYDKFEADVLGFDEIERFFSKNILNEYINKQIKSLDFLPEEAVKYMDEKQKKLFEIYSISYRDISYGGGSTTLDEDTKAPDRSVTILPLSYNSYSKIENKKPYLDLIKKLGKDFMDYPSFFMGLPITFFINNKLYFFMPKEKDLERSTEYYLVDEEGNILLKDNTDDIKILDKSGKELEQNSTIGSTTGNNSVYITESDFDKIKIDKINGGTQVLTKNDFSKLKESYEIDSWNNKAMLIKAGIL